MREDELDYLVEAAQRFYNEAGLEFPDNARERRTTFCNFVRSFTMYISVL